MSLVRNALGLCLVASVICAASMTGVIAYASISSVVTIPSKFLTELSFPDQEATPQEPLPKNQDSGQKGELPLPEGEGRDTAKRLCSKCHSTDLWVRQRHSRERWSSIIDNMVSKGLEASDEDLVIVTDYLAAHLAPEKKDAPAPTTPPQR